MRQNAEKHSDPYRYEAMPKPAELPRINRLIARIARQTGDRGYIFRGEDKLYELPLSSSLFREYQREPILDILDVEDIQDIEIDTARKHAPGIASHDDIAHQLQHFQGKTNLIDFTRDIATALFFACDGEHVETGYVYALEPDHWRNYIITPVNPPNRVIAQKSVFLAPPQGFVPKGSYIMLAEIPAELKLPILDYLSKHHGISKASIYNDIHGFIRQRTTIKDTLIAIGRAVEQFTHGDYAGAIGAFDRIIRLDPETAVTYLYRGNAHYYQNHQQQAIADFTEAIRRDPSLAMAYNNRAMCRYDKEQYEAAIDDYHEALNLDPEFAFAHNNIGLAYLADGDPDEAERHFRIATRLEPEIGLFWYNLGFLYHIGENFRQAIRLYGQALRLSPDLRIATQSRSAAVRGQLPP